MPAHAFASFHGARIHTSRSSSVVSITGMALSCTGAIAPFGSLLAPIFSNPHRLRATTTCRAPTVLPIGSGATSTPLPSDLEDESGWDLFSGRLGGSTRLGRRPLLGEPGEARVQQGSDDGANDRRCQV